MDNFWASYSKKQLQQYLIKWFSKDYSGENTLNTSGFRLLVIYLAAKN